MLRREGKGERESRVRGCALPGEGGGKRELACVSLPVRLPKTAAAWRLVGSCFAADDDDADDDDADADDWKVTGQNGSKYSMVCACVFRGWGVLEFATQTLAYGIGRSAFV